MAAPEPRENKRDSCFDRLLWRIVVVMALGVICAQTLGTLLWAHQLRQGALAEALNAGKNMAMNAAGTEKVLANVLSGVTPRSAAIDS